MGDFQNRRLVFIDRPPSDLRGYDYKPSVGERAAEHYPEDARITLQPESPGLQLADLLGNALKYLIVSSRVKELIATHEVGEIEMLPFTLYNHKGRVHSTDFCVVNPIGTFDCLDRTASDIRYVEDGDSSSDIVKVHTYVFDGAALADAPDLFRIPEDLQEYFVSERLARALHQAQCSNVFIHRIEQTPSAS